MNVHYKIVEVWPQDHLIVVRYWTDIISEEFLASSTEKNENGSFVRCRTDVALSVPVPAPSNEELEKFILNNIPYNFLKTLENVLDPNVDTSMQSIFSMKNKKFTKENYEPIDPLSTKELSEDEIKTLIDSISNK